MFPYGAEMIPHAGWSLRFDQTVFDYAVEAEMPHRAQGTPVREAEETLQIDVWNNDQEQWEELDIDAYLTGPTGTFHLLRRRGLFVCRGFDTVRSTLQAATHPDNVPAGTFQFPYLHFRRSQAPYRAFQEGVHFWHQEGGAFPATMDGLF